MPNLIEILKDEIDSSTMVKEATFLIQSLSMLSEFAYVFIGLKIADTIDNAIKKHINRS